MIKDDMKQKISELMDGEMEHGAQTTLDQMTMDKAMLHLWERYHMISDALNQELPVAIDRTLAGRIADKISAEPYILAPAGIFSNRIFKQAVGFALAASVTAIAILGARYNNDNNLALEQKKPVQIVDNSQDLNPGPLQYTFPASSTSVTTETEDVEIQPETNSRLSSYLVNYNEYRASQTGVQGIIPYVRIISNENTE